MFPIRGKWEKKWFRKAASTVFNPNTIVVESSADDTITPGTSADTILVGIVMKKVSAGDSDFADNTRIPVMVPLDSGSEMLADTSADIALTDEGELHDLNDSVSINPAASANDCVKLKQFVAARKGVYIIYKKAMV